MAPSCEPLPRSLKNIFLVTNCEKIAVSDFSSEKPLESKAKRFFFFTCRGFGVFIFMTWAVDLCGASQHSSAAVQKVTQGVSSITCGSLPALIS